MPQHNHKAKDQSPTHPPWALTEVTVFQATNMPLSNNTTLSSSTAQSKSSVDDDDDHRQQGGCDHDHGRDREDKFLIAIIGGGFAGLTLANYLEKQQQQKQEEHDNRQCTDEDLMTTNQQKSFTTGSGHRQGNTTSCEYCIFESKKRPLPIIGTIRLPSGRSVFQELDLDWNQLLLTKNKRAADTNNNTVTVDVPREPVLEILRSKVRKKIQFSCRVVDIVKKKRIKRRRLLESDDDDDDDSSNNGHGGGIFGNYQYYVRTVDTEYHQHTKAYNRRRSMVVVDDYEEENERQQLHGPFDMVVGAEGFVLNSRESSYSHRHRSSLNIENVHARIGDRRWQDTVPWYDFGRRRRTQGADIAMNDGIELGKKLLMIIKAAQQQYDDRNNTDSAPNYDDDHLVLLSELLGKFKTPSESERRSTQQQKQILYYVVVLPMFLVMFRCLIQSFEKI
jgi:hypothetical protein